MKEMKMKEEETCNNATADLGQPHLNKWQISNKIKLSNVAFDLLMSEEVVISLKGKNFQSHLPLVKR